MVVQNDTKITPPHSLTRNSENANLALKGALSILRKQGTWAGGGAGGLTLPRHCTGQGRAAQKWGKMTTANLQREPSWNGGARAVAEPGVGSCHPRTLCRDV